VKYLKIVDGIIMQFRQRINVLSVYIEINNTVRMASDVHGGMIFAYLKNVPGS
jgi:hypothetical protein